MKETINGMKDRIVNRKFPTKNVNGVEYHYEPDYFMTAIGVDDAANELMSINGQPGKALFKNKKKYFLNFHQNRTWLTLFAIQTTTI